MKLHCHTPRRPLSALITRFWYVERIPSHRFERVLPAGDMALVCSLDGAGLLEYDALGTGVLNRCTGPAIKGAYSRGFVVDTRVQGSLIGVQFRAGGAYPFLGDVAHRFSNQHVALDAVWGRRAASALHQRLIEARTPRARFEHLERVLIERLRRGLGTRRHHAAVAAALASLAGSEEPSIAEVVRASGLSWRRFIELFRREVGMAPKTFARIQRFQRALRRLVAEPRDTTARLALDTGYYDQAHLLRDFAQFANTTPGRYLATRGKLLNYLPLPVR